jgi:2',3'-cyclic-nucleotide 2'-phosphodiesterase (5'-nucleotidase family)
MVVENHFSGWTMKKVRPSALSVFVILLVFFFGNSFASETSVISLKIIHMNDLHGHLEPAVDKTASPASMHGGAAYFGAMVLGEKSADPQGAIVLSAGDMFQGTPVSNVFRGRPVTEIMNYLGFDAMALGNHEFDWGWPELRKMESQARFPYLAANLANKDGSAVQGIKKAIYLERKSIRIAVIGIVTPDTPFSTNPRNVKDFSFQTPESVLPGMISEARNAGAKLVLVLSHCGLDRDRAIAERVPGIDIIVGGHSHTVVTPPYIAGKTIIVQAGSWGNYLGVLDLQLDPATGRVLKYSRDNLKPVIAGPGIVPDNKINGIIRKYSDKIKKEFSRVVGRTRTDLLRSPDGESNLGDLICDAMRSEAAAEIAFYNSGGIRADIFKGKIRLEQAFETLPFDNVMVSMDLTGAQIRSILEHGAAREFGIVQVSGMKVKINPSNPRGGRVVEALISGRALEPERTYRVATNEFLASGGDRYVSFKQGKNIVYGDDVRDVFVRHLEKHSPVSPGVEGRIEIVQ